LYQKETYSVQLEAMDSQSAPFIITQPEFMRRMKEMSQSGGGGGMFNGQYAGMYNCCQYKLSVSNNQHKRRRQIKSKTLGQALTWQIIAKPIERGSLDYFVKSLR
jgi:molecular chaperone HtpG